MSDARAKAEARRAKILARDSSKKVTAIGDDLTLPVDGTPVERPLARRRQLVESLAEKAEGGDGEQSTPVKGSGGDESVPATPATPNQETPNAKAAKEDNTDDPGVESIEQFEESLSEKKEEAASQKKATILKALSPKKSLKEIEEEVARNTAKYDADTMKGDSISKTKRTSKEMKDATNNAKKAIATATNINPTNVTRLIRMFVIIALGSYKGYTVVQNNIASRDSAMIQAMEGTSFQNAVSFDEFGDAIATNPAEWAAQQEAARGSTNTGTGTGSGRTWAQYAQYKVTAPFESTLTAVGVSYWLANMLSTGINSRLKAPPKAKGYMEQLLSLYQSGFEGVLERVFCLIGEYALHLGTILLVATVLTLYTEIPAIGDASSTSTLAGAVTSAVASAVSQAVGVEETGVQMEL